MSIRSSSRADRGRGGGMGAGGALLLAFVLLGAAASSAPAHLQQASPMSSPGGREGRTEVLGENYKRTPAGFYRVKLPGGGSVLTHGPDPKRPMNPIDLDGTFPGGASERAPVCASDRYQHVLYAHLSGEPNMVSAQAPVIRTSMRQINALLNAESLAGGGPTADYKVLCDAVGEVRIDSFATPRIAIADVVAAAKRSGFSDPRADYTIFVDAISTFCGIATFESDATLSPDNRSNDGGAYALAYRDCWLDETPMHENAHNMGAVQADSPSSTGSGAHCAEERDVLCYSPDGGDRNQGGSVSRCSDRVHFDCGSDDYFDTTPEPGEYLASHWNLGSPLNRFIALGQGTQLEAPCGKQRCAVTIEPNAPARIATAAPAGGWAYHRIAIPRGLKRVDVGIDGPCEPRAPACETQLGLYLRRGRVPTANRWACRARRPGADQLCRLRRPRGGTWYAGVRTIAAPPSTAFTIQARSRG